eukprot:TRINITY_DN5121_c0_g1_i1.p1 TRINITY_DN5121_c0_g1~~TRINITY_DN5121_c0_g1_i1.p1  ORF type:complete len:385 (-),score=111.27 TRINITY_DN5121_c0_g1_i1:732-1886(-)
MKMPDDGAQDGNRNSDAPVIANGNQSDLAESAAPDSNAAPGTSTSHAVSASDDSGQIAPITDVATTLNGRTDGDDIGGRMSPGASASAADNAQQPPAPQDSSLVWHGSAVDGADEARASGVANVNGMTSASAGAELKTEVPWDERGYKRAVKALQRVQAVHDEVQVLLEQAEEGNALLLQMLDTADTARGFEVTRYGAAVRNRAQVSGLVVAGDSRARAQRTAAENAAREKAEARQAEEILSQDVFAAAARRREAAERLRSRCDGSQHRIDAKAAALAAAEELHKKELRDAEAAAQLQLEKAKRDSNNNSATKTKVEVPRLAASQRISDDEELALLLNKGGGRRNRGAATSTSPSSSPRRTARQAGSRVMGSGRGSARSLLRKR